MPQYLHVGLRLRVAAQDYRALIGCGQMHVQHLYRGKLFQHRARRQAGREIAQAAA